MTMLTRMLRLGLVAACALAAPAHADTLEAIVARGTLVVGVKRDVPLWGFQDPQTGALKGLEVDLAHDLAARLGVKLRLVGLASAERMDAIDRRQVDLLIATLSDTPERRERVTMVRPHYYASGVNILSRKTSGFREWSELRNRRICARRGTFYNRLITVASGVDVVALYDNSLAIAAFREGRCDALLYDDTNIAAMLQEPRWSRHFEMPLKTLFVTPWAVALHRDDADSRLHDAVAQAIVAWHRSGRMLELERKWGIPLSEFSARMNALWSRRVRSAYYCGERVSAETPKECL